MYDDEGVDETVKSLYCAIVSGVCVATGFVVLNCERMCELVDYHTVFRR